MGGPTLVQAMACGGMLARRGVLGKAGLLPAPPAPLVPGLLVFLHHRGANGNLSQTSKNCTAHIEESYASAPLETDCSPLPRGSGWNRSWGLSPRWCSRAHAEPSLRFTKGPHRGLEHTQTLSSVGPVLPWGHASPGSARLTSPALRAHFIPSGALHQPVSFPGESARDVYRGLLSCSSRSQVCSLEIKQESGP